MKRNIELLTKVRDLVEKQPEKLNMENWAWCDVEWDFDGDGYKKVVDCGTTACIAGWAVQLHGYKFLLHDGDQYAIECIARNGRVMNIEYKAQELLGLTDDEANSLFINTSKDDAVDRLNDLIDGKTHKEIWGY